MGALWLAFGQVSHAQMLTSNLEIKRLSNIGAIWQTISLENTYTDAIVVCTYNLPNSASPPAVTRVRNITTSSFDLRIQQFENSSAVTPNDVHCVIANEGPYNSGGLKYEARKVLSTNTSGLAVGWGNTTTEDVTLDVTQVYSNPHVVGQVMSFNDAKASVFWNNDCESRGNGAFFSGYSDGICVGKHIGQINGIRASETLGYIVVEAGSATVNDISFAAAVGPDTGAGVGNSPPYSYSVTGDFDTGILTDAGEDGGQGGWAVLYGSNPLPSGQIAWAIDEEIVAGDTTRRHTSENVGYWVFANDQTPDLEALKTVALFTGNPSPYAIPGSDAIYTLTTTNLGSGPVDKDSLFFVDALPDEVTFYYDDIDDGGPLTSVTQFQEAGSNISYLEATDLAFSDGLTAPTNFASCNYTPASAGYDPNIRFVCFNPKGTFSEGTITGSEFSISFRVMVN